MSDSEVTTPEAVSEETPKPAAEPEAKAPAKHKPVPAAEHAVVGGGETDPVHLSALVYKNTFQRKSLSVHHLQRRLGELGHIDALADKDGWYAEHTKNSVLAFQKERKLGAQDGIVDADTLDAIFEGDHNVTVDHN